MKVGLVGPTYQQRSKPFDAQRSINLYPVFDDQGKEVAAMYGTPGLELFATAGNGPVRGEFKSTTGRAFAVSGSGLYEVLSDGTTSLKGTLNTSSGNITIDENPTQLFICDGEDGYTFTYATDVFAAVADGDFPSAGTATYIDGYFVVNQNSTGKFFISAINDGTSWDALDYATAESSPDVLKRVIRGFGQLCLLGEKTSEIWTNTGDASFPFQKISGADIEMGILAPYSAVAYGGSVFLVGSSNEGAGIVIQLTGTRPRRISTEAIEIMIAAASDKENIKGFAYQQDGHDFYMLTGGGLETSLVYDLSAGLWHERAYKNADGSFGLHLANCHMYAFENHLVGDRRNGNIYKLKMDVYSDNGDEIARERIYTHLSDEGNRVRFNSLEVGFETGVGLQSGQGADPQATLYVSRDGARTWSIGESKSIGAVGEYNKKVVWRRLSVTEQLTFKLRITDPVKVAITGSYLK